MRDHAQRVVGLPDVAVAEHRHVERLLERGDRVPVGRAGVALRGGARVQGDRGDAGVLGDQAGLDVGQVVVVDALAHLDRDRDAGRRGRLDRRRDDAAEQPPPPRQRRAAALAGDLGHRAAEVEVDVVGQVLLDDHPHRGRGDVRVDAVELEAAGPLVRRRTRSSAASSGFRSTSARVVIISQT